MQNLQKYFFFINLAASPKMSNIPRLAASPTMFFILRLAVSPILFMF